MKKSLLVLLSLLLLAAVLLTACGASKIHSKTELNDKVIAFLSNPVGDLSAQIGAAVNITPKRVDTYDNVSACITALKSGKADAYLCPEFVAAYYANIDDTLTTVPTEGQNNFTVRMVVRDDNTELLQSLNDAIASLRTSGMLDSLALTHVESAQKLDATAGEDFAVIEGAPTLLIGMSGDAAPLDFLSIDGKPAGYNIAVLNELGKLMNVNFEVVSVKNEAKLTALQSKKIDVYFYQLEGSISGFGADKVLSGNGVSLSEPYFAFDCFAFLVKK